MRLITLLISLLWGTWVYSQSSSTHYRSSIRGSLTSGSLSDNSTSMASVVNVWTEAHEQTSSTYANRTVGNVTNGIDSLNSGITNLLSPWGINVYPNPGNSIFWIDSEQRIDFIEVYGPLGNLVKSTHQINKIDGSDWSSGIYTVRLLSGNQQTTLRLIKI